MWRNHWGISPSDRLDEPLYESAAAQDQRAMGEITREMFLAKFLKVEYQSIRRLSETSYLLFTIKTMVDPLSILEKVPKARTRA